MAPAGPSPIAALRYVSEILSSGRVKAGTLALGIEAVHEARAVIERALTHHHHEWCMVGDCGCGRCVVCGELADAKTANSAAYFATFSEHEEDICTGCGEPLSNEGHG